MANIAACPNCGTRNRVPVVAPGHAGRLKIVKVDVDTAPGVSARFQVQGIPTLLLFQDGRPVGRKVGAAPEGALEAWLAAPAT